ncbi:Protein of unknown function (DUF3109) [Candidatus Kryptobacter tengchongensis]|uniref:DUF3109 family protein n=1 Tax=Kryptobacter tengchongensis TaxID=1643429 RepID=UPI000707900A|nr:DUF3109 family protein [Candidatus Kryptobacter tengchongensis]CUS85446.1 Protein of unknown function (DUF3109) [Candidatus Kryptobacter tengchongensis]CUU10568.1 Protein of unknown function (DUF3109) [Candidatus Kryptobacter tengchongensis]
MSLRAIFIDGIYVDPEIANSYFMCDLEKCKGACCFMEGDFGAPLLKEEIETIQSLLPVVKKYLPEKNVKFIEKYGFYEKSDTGFATLCIDRRECVFVFWENGVARCSFEKAFLKGETNFRKPISCHLFPLRNYGINGSFVGGEVLKYVKINECRPAIKKGKEENVKLYEFLKPALIRYFGQNWYNKMLEKLKSLNNWR